MVRQVTYKDKDAADDFVIYPESDGQPMADNTVQFRWIVLIKEGLEILFAAIQDIFIAGDLLWYPVQGQDKSCAPDIMVVFGRPKGDRGRYLQWQEANIAPQVVFEILSPSNTKAEMDKKRDFYEKHGVEEYYLYDPQKNNLQGWLRSKKSLKQITNINGWTSPRLGIRFVLTTTLEIYRPDGLRFVTPVELDQQRQQAEQRALLEQQRRQQAEQLAETERLNKEAAQNELAQERQRYQELLKQLQDRGIDL
ncbi:MAG: Uma2 family endonuclease [Calothrix sp. FI2-JRJ7]|jgi:Uma2 family endonuclease|nr:Uma2 family endonuclease [Calothrix sp. FI2-JRJ7]